MLDEFMAFFRDYHVVEWLETRRIKWPSNGVSSLVECEMEDQSYLERPWRRWC